MCLANHHEKVISCKQSDRYFVIIQESSSRKGAGMKVIKNAVLVSIAATMPLYNCARYTPPPPPLIERNYIDIQPGWRLRVIIPILASGGYTVALEPTPGPGGALTFTTGEGFEGYEMDNYTVASNKGKIAI